MKLPSKIKGWFNPSMSAEQLFSLFVKTGKQHYLSQLIDDFNLTLFHYLLSQSDHATAEDVLQSTWLKVMKQRNVSATNVSIKSWLFTIARNTLIDELRRQHRWQTSPLDDHHLMSAPLDKQIEHQTTLDRFNSALLSLPFHQREAFILQQEGFSLPEIALLTSEKHETVKSRLRYARQVLKTKLEEEL